MSLSKQLGIGFFIVLALVFAGSLWVNVNNTRDFIQHQLQSHAQDTATSLGLSITPYIGVEEDFAIIDTMTNAIFDRGYYQSITLTDATNKVLLDKQNPTELESVPAWFVDMFPIDAPITISEINNGWNIAGNLAVVSNPGFGYLQLWRNAIDTFWVIAGIFILGLIFVYFLVKAITKPINAVVESASRISDRHFEIIDKIPRTPELRTFVNAINKMSQKLGLMFSQLTTQSEKYRQFAYSDQLTTVGNRRAFDLAINQLLRDEEQHIQGFLVVIRLSSLAEVNHSLGKEDGDNYVKTICEHTKDIAKHSLAHFSMYRISGADFAVLLEGSSLATCEALVRQLSEQYKRIEKSEYSNGTAHIGTTAFAYGMTYPDVMQKADSALAIAESQENKYQFAGKLSVNYSNQEWRVKIDKLLSQKQSDFAAQSINDSHGKTIYQEWFARLPNKSSSDLIPMAQLIPASIRLDSAEQLDQMIMSAALEKISTMPQLTCKVGINLSRMSLLDHNFQKWLLNKLESFDSVAAGNLASKIVIEIPERALVNDTKQLAKFVGKIKQKGLQITVERFGAQLAGLMHLRDIKPDYLKIDGRYIRNIQNEPDNQLFVQSLVSIAHSLNIKIIAETVESIEESQWLTQAHVDYQQGYYISAPKIL